MEPNSEVLDLFDDVKMFGASLTLECSGLSTIKFNKDISIVFYDDEQLVQQFCAATKVSQLVYAVLLLWRRIPDFIISSGFTGGSELTWVVKAITSLALLSHETPDCLFCPSNIFCKFCNKQDYDLIKALEDISYLLYHLARRIKDSYWGVNSNLETKIATKKRVVKQIKRIRNNILLKREELGILPIDYKTRVVALPPLLSQKGAVTVFSTCIFHQYPPLPENIAQNESENSLIEKIVKNGNTMTLKAFRFIGGESLNLSPEQMTGLVTAATLLPGGAIAIGVGLLAHRGYRAITAKDNSNSENEAIMDFTNKNNSQTKSKKKSKKTENNEGEKINDYSRVEHTNDEDNKVSENDCENTVPNIYRYSLYTDKQKNTTSSSGLDEPEETENKPMHTYDRVSEYSDLEAEEDNLNSFAGGSDTDSISYTDSRFSISPKQRYEVITDLGNRNLIKDSQVDITTFVEPVSSLNILDKKNKNMSYSNTCNITDTHHSVNNNQDKTKKYYTSQYNFLNQRISLSKDDMTGKKFKVKDNEKNSYFSEETKSVIKNMSINNFGLNFCDDSIISDKTSDNFESNSEDLHSVSEEFSATVENNSFQSNLNLEQGGSTLLSHLNIDQYSNVEKYTGVIGSTYKDTIYDNIKENYETSDLNIIKEKKNVSEEEEVNLSTLEATENSSHYYLLTGTSYPSNSELKKEDNSDNNITSIEDNNLDNSKFVENNSHDEENKESTESSDNWPKNVAALEMLSCFMVNQKKFSIYFTNLSTGYFVNLGFQWKVDKQKIGENTHQFAYIRIPPVNSCPIVDCENLVHQFSPDLKSLELGLGVSVSLTLTNMKTDTTTLLCERLDLLRGDRIVVYDSKNAITNNYQDFTQKCKLDPNLSQFLPTQVIPRSGHLPKFHMVKSRDTSEGQIFKNKYHFTIKNTTLRIACHSIENF